jgi:hypothetical protein
VCRSLAEHAQWGRPEGLCRLSRPLLPPPVEKPTQPESRREQRQARWEWHFGRAHKLRSYGVECGIIIARIERNTT